LNESGRRGGGGGGGGAAAAAAYSVGVNRNHVGDRLSAEWHAEDVEPVVVAQVGVVGGGACHVGVDVFELDPHLLLIRDWTRTSS